MVEMWRAIVCMECGHRAALEDEGGGNEKGTTTCPECGGRLRFRMVRKVA